MQNGILNIHKPLNITSHDVIKKLRKIFNIKKIGHAGTLDPAASGVLPICIGKVTRLIQYFPTDKQYIAEITLGKTTNTYDKEGEFLTQTPVNLSTMNIEGILSQFIGEVEQEVPLTSATHYKGEKLYKYAQKNIDIKDLPRKKVVFYAIELLDILNPESDHPTIKLKIDCGSGTYIRSLANDIGKLTGSGAYLSNLIRTKSANMAIEKSYTLEEIEEAIEKGTIQDILIPPANIIPWPELTIGFGQIERLAKGQYFRPLSASFQEGEKIFLTNNNVLIAIGEYNQQQGIIKPKLVFIDT